ncbi:putative NRPS-like protein biosynthetic cluster [Microsporum audouinii]
MTDNRLRLRRLLRDIRTQAPENAIHQLEYLLNNDTGLWPFEDLIRCYQTVWKALPETIRDGNDLTWNITIDRVHLRLKHFAPHMEDLLHSDTSQPALIDTDHNKEISHAMVQEFVKNFDLGLDCSTMRKPRVMVVLPNGPSLALAVLAVANRYTLVPMARPVTTEQLKSDIQAVGADAVLMLEADAHRFQLDSEIVIFVVHPQDNLTFKVSRWNHTNSPSHVRTSPNGPDDLAIILFTSGTSGTKKLVPISTFNLMASIIFTMDSLGLDSSSSCLNMMPLHHIGGMVRSLWAPVFARGITICCPRFDPSFFWDAVEQWRPTWYYATPTMHHMILAEAENCKDAVRGSSIKFICNAGGGLPPTLAEQLHSTFRCVVLPSYGMTECAPIAAPPLDYNLKRVGASGLPAGPDLAILDIAQPMKRVPTGATGRICVRGLPVFTGYLTSQGVDRTAFDAAGWFDTGDLGRIDEAGYLYITGRSKEVINRGGEIISPLEVEDAIMSAAKDSTSAIFGRVTETMAFSTPHDVLQEVVGAVIVTPADCKRPDLRQIHEALKDRLDQPKWPTVLVYMDNIPKSNNKLRRIQLSRRLGLETLTNNTLPSECHYEAKCPPPDTPLNVSINQTRCTIDPRTLKAHITEISGISSILIRTNSIDGYLQAILFNCALDEVLVDNISTCLRTLVNGYLIPSSIKVINGAPPVDSRGSIDTAAVEAAINTRDQFTTSPTEQRVCSLFASALRLAPEDVTSSTDFFLAGGDSLAAGRLVSQIRQEFHIRLASDVLFRHSTVAKVSTVVQAAMDLPKTEYPKPEDLPGLDETYSSTNLAILLLNLIPLAVFSPILQTLRWSLFVYILIQTFRWQIRNSVVGRLSLILVAGLASRYVMQVFSPILGIAFKWLLIGRYRAGMYPMWGPYHTRWWLTQKALQVCGKGVFDHFGFTRILYYRALGARIGRNVHIDTHASLGEYDLIDIGDDVVLEDCSCRPFSAERNTTMLLQPIRIGANCTVGLKTVIASGTDLPPGTCLGPSSSSWETEDAAESNRALAPAQIPQPHWIWYILVVGPLSLLVGLVSRLPAILGFLPVVMRYRHAESDMLRQQILWFVSPSRIGYYVLVILYGAILGPFAWFFAVYVVKLGLDLSCGPYGQHTQSQMVRRAVLDCILPQGDISQLTRVIGTHYELVSIAVRMLGARVGKRVYWPGTGIAVQEYDLLEIGNDVVFGSRSTFITCDGTGMGRISIGDGAFVGDHVVALPGVTIGKRTTVGSGALLRRNGLYPDNTTWTGSKHGDAIQFPRNNSPRNHGQESLEKPSLNHDGDDTISPFGRAFYEGQANYYVLGIVPIVAYSVLATAFGAVYSASGILTGLLVVSRLLHMDRTTSGPHWWWPFLFYAAFTAVVGVVTLIQAAAALGIKIAAKWTILGRRREGYYPWDRSSYCQRWQILLTIERIFTGSGRMNAMPLLTGTAYMVQYYRALGATIGADCALAASGEGVLLTEPDLVTLGNRVAIDNASLVGHLNTRGEFELHTLRVGNRSVLRTKSRLLSGASIGNDACLLEHTLVLSGDHIDDGCTVQGWPAEPFIASRVGHSLHAP